MIEGKDLFWLTVVEVSVHGVLAPLPWACNEPAQHGGGHAHFMAEVK